MAASTYLQAVEHGFINYDDPLYVSEYNHAGAGLTQKGIWWALTVFHATNWHPTIRDEPHRARNNPASSEAHYNLGTAMREKEDPSAARQK